MYLAQTSQKPNRKKVHIIYAYLFYKIKEHIKTKTINYGYAKEILSRNLRIIPGGLPQVFVTEIINDMIDYNLFIKRDLRTLIITNNKCDKKIKTILSCLA